MENKLVELGFDKNEAKTYLVLLEIGKTSVGRIVEKTGLHRELVYQAFRRLEQKGYVHSSISQKKRHYQPENPQVLLDHIQAKEAEAREILPSLLEKFQSSPQIIRILEGEEGFEEVQKDKLKVMKKGETYYVIGAAGKGWYQTTKDFFYQYHLKQQKKGITSQMVSYKGEAEEILKNEPPGFAEVRVLSQEFSPPASTKIYADRVAIQIFGPQPVVLLIQNPSVAEVYKEYFQALWKVAEKIE
ncbi:MAG: Transcriptional regulator, TrmB [Candidatus Berkelbacteria bacterium Licking1014_7]|uniref:Transcriptional regulator, TrmB n=1 Tax=Candidatus Berkelbacteria bacterium Licking1014_7 TaxID=2017147 RepID=A0A554LJR3_9BACT|nr:MAG: Transcriptional regulator, TrmB [Candidatus Berkelbacteria bacterium Licking1014_7]